MTERIVRRVFLVMAGGTLAAARVSWSQIAEVPTLLDHILLGCSDLDRGIAFVEERTGVRAMFGGVHPGRGTQNALLSLGERRYLEIIAPDPKQPAVQQFTAISKLTEPRLIGWAAHEDHLEIFAKLLQTEGVEFDGPRAGSRERPDGKVLHWKSLTLRNDQGGLLPFFIEWSKDSIHPSADAPKGCSLLRFEATTPEPEALLVAARRAHVDLQVSSGDKPSLQAAIAGPKGEFSITS